MRSRARGWFAAAATVLLAGCTAPGLNPTGAQPSATYAGAQAGMPAGSRVIQGLKKPFGVAAERGAVWVTEYEAGNLVRIDTSTNRITARIHLGAAHASHPVIQNGFVWVMDDQGGAVIAVDARTHQLSKNIAMGPTPELRPFGLTAGEGSLWVVLARPTGYYADPKNRPSHLVRVDPASGTVLADIPVPGNTAGVAVGGGAVWVVSTLEPVTIYRIDPTTNRIAARIDTGQTPSGALVFQEPYLWAANQNGYLTRIDARTNGATLFEVGSPEWPALVAEGGAIWISAPLDNIVARFDPGTGTVTRTVHAGSRPQEFAFLGNDMWVANYIDGTVARIPIN